MNSPRQIPALTLSDDQFARSRKNETQILRAIANTKQTVIASTLGIDDSTISRLLNSGDIERFARILAICGLKVLPESIVCFDPKSIDAILTLARERMAQIDAPEKLSWDE